jgi:hypothetical protein
MIHEEGQGKWERETREEGILISAALCRERERTPPNVPRRRRVTNGRHRKVVLHSIWFGRLGEKEKYKKEGGLGEASDALLGCVGGQMKYIYSLTGISTAGKNKVVREFGRGDGGDLSHI